MRQLFARLRRHREVQEDRERTERVRVAVATAWLVNVQGPKKAVEPWDIFPDLRAARVVEDDEMSPESAQLVLSWFRGLAMAQEKREH